LRERNERVGNGLFGEEKGDSDLITKRNEIHKNKASHIYQILSKVPSPVLPTKKEPTKANSWKGTWKMLVDENVPMARVA